VNVMIWYGGVCMFYISRHSSREIHHWTFSL
jgi:hypothetical protein